MRFTIPYAYPASYTLRRHRRVETAVLLAETVVDIAEVPVPDHPAYELGNSVRPGDGTYGSWVRFRVFGGRPARVWRIEGDGLFAEYCGVESLTKRVGVQRDNPFNVDDENDDWVLPFEMFQSHERATTHAELGGHKALRHWDDDGGKAKADLIARRASAMRIVDGMVCVSVGEPILLVHQSARVVTTVVTEDIADRRGGVDAWSEPWHGKRFRLDQLEAARTFARRTADRKSVV